MSTRKKARSARRRDLNVEATVGGGKCPTRVEFFYHPADAEEWAKKRARRCGASYYEIRHVPTGRGERVHMARGSR